MAITNTPLASLSSSTDATSYATGSFTPSADTPVTVFVSSQTASGTPNTPTLSGNGITWAQIGSSVSSGTNKLSSFRGLAASPSAGALTADFAGQTQIGCEISVMEFPGANSSGTSGSGAIGGVKTATAAGGSTSISLTLVTGDGLTNDPDARMVGAFRHNNNEGKTPRTSWTEIHDLSHGSPANGLETQWRSDAPETTGSATWASGSAALAILIEVLAASRTVTVPAAANFNVQGGGGLGPPVIHAGAILTPDSASIAFDSTPPVPVSPGIVVAPSGASVAFAATAPVLVITTDHITIPAAAIMTLRGVGPEISRQRYNFVIVHNQLVSPHGQNPWASGYVILQLIDLAGNPIVQAITLAGMSFKRIRGRIDSQGRWALSVPPNRFPGVGPSTKWRVAQTSPDGLTVLCDIVVPNTQARYRLQDLIV